MVESSADDRREWEHEWQLLEPLLIESPEEVLPELAGLVERMAAASGFPLDEGAARESPDRAAAAEFLGAREVARALARGEEVDREGIGAAITVLRGLYEDLLSRL